MNTFSTHCITNGPQVRASAEVIAKRFSCDRPGCPCGKRQGKGWITHCPVSDHDDDRPSLNLTDAINGRLLVHCFGGCSQDAVIAALREQRLWPETTLQGVTLGALAQAKGLPLDFLKGLGWRDSK